MTVQRGEFKQTNKQTEVKVLQNILPPCFPKAMWFILKRGTKGRVAVVPSFQLFLIPFLVTGQVAIPPVL